ncbi:MAG: hypothetical protein ACKOU7_12245 [Ferruginibacter sp.]
MKKIFTLLVSTAMLSTAFAQYGQRDQRNRENNDQVYAANTGRDYDRHDNSYGKDGRRYERRTYVFTFREKNMQIDQIYREYNYRIESVKNKPFMSWYQKRRLVNNLEAQRDAEICQVNERFNSPDNLFGDYGRHDKKRW